MVVGGLMDSIGDVQLTAEAGNVERAIIGGYVRVDKMYGWHGIELLIEDTDLAVMEIRDVEIISAVVGGHCYPFVNAALRRVVDCGGRCRIAAGPDFNSPVFRCPDEKR